MAASAQLFIFGVAGMALAAMGMYGLVSYTVTQSMHEIGIRMALGAQGIEVVWHFLRRGLRLGAVGAPSSAASPRWPRRASSAACSSVSARPIRSRSLARSRSCSEA